MRARLIHWLGGVTLEEAAATMREAELKYRETQPKFCTIRPDCVMQEGHLGGCRDISGYCFTTLHQHELRRKREERDRKALEELTAKPAGVSQ